ncbi:hypothetical protein EDB81DRAFT_198097 [Dactylonectria macrodidyma]|uniref:Uncharacterized protein n=1 Tax=Dactylonectria macrodidyma TaxID=307937 RepID=A0A9P9JLZ1_9HYPO|nr:hypothetical protein EDB81DRAFT_198097 [Dactylonectria macrodidyma]
MLKVDVWALRPVRCFVDTRLQGFQGFLGSLVSHLKWPSFPHNFRTLDGHSPSSTHQTATPLTFGLHAMPWFSWQVRLPIGFGNIRGEWRIPRHVLGPIIRTFISMMALSTGNVVFPIFNIGGTSASWVLFALNLIWLTVATTCVWTVGRFRLNTGAYDPTVRLSALTMTVGWCCIATINLAFMTTAICRCYQSNDLEYCALFGISNLEASNLLVKAISDTQWAPFLWAIMVLTMCATVVPSWDWTVQHRRIRERILLRLGPR